MERHDAPWSRCKRPAAGALERRSRAIRFACSTTCLASSTGSDEASSASRNGRGRSRLSQPYRARRRSKRRCGSADGLYLDVDSRGGRGAGVLDVRREQAFEFEDVCSAIVPRMPAGRSRSSSSPIANRDAPTPGPFDADPEQGSVDGTDGNDAGTTVEENGLGGEVPAPFRQGYQAMTLSPRLITPEKRGEDADQTCGRRRSTSSSARPRRAPI